MNITHFMSYQVLHKFVFSMLKVACRSTSATPRHTLWLVHKNSSLHEIFYLPVRYLSFSIDTLAVSILNSNTILLLRENLWVINASMISPSGLMSKCITSLSGEEKQWQWCEPKQHQYCDIQKTLSLSYWYYISSNTAMSWTSHPENDLFFKGSHTSYLHSSYNI